MAEFRERISVLDKDGKNRVSIDPSTPLISFVRDRVFSRIDHNSITIGAMRPATPNIANIFGPDILGEMDLAPRASLVVGSKDQPGAIRVMDAKGEKAFVVDDSTGTIQSRMTLQMLDDRDVEVLRFDRKTANLQLGGQGNEGDLQILNGNGKVVIHLDGHTGDVKILDDSGAVLIHLDGDEPDIKLKGDLKILDVAGGVVIHLDRKARDIKLKGDLKILDDAGGVVIDLDRKARDIKLKGADCAEVFAAHDASVLEPGTVCVIGPSGALEPCSKTYDTRVAGVVAGAGDLHPGIVLGQGTVAEQTVALSITGRVWCKVDAGFGPIAPGDLVTTSTTPGHGMRADDRSRLTGTIVGKALAALPAGCEFIPILVGLQ